MQVTRLSRLVLLMRYTKYPYSPSVLPLQNGKGDEVQGRVLECWRGPTGWNEEIGEGERERDCRGR